MIKRTERGWPGHFICAHRCIFRLNTLLELDNIKVVVSTVGLMEVEGKYETIGVDRYFETMAFYAKEDDKYNDADVSRYISLECKQSINKIEAEIEANEMHEESIKEISERLMNKKL